MRTFILVFISIVWLSKTPASIAFGQDLSIELPDTVAIGSSSLTIPVRVDDLTGLDLVSLEFTLSFDSTVIRIDDVIAEGYLAEVLALLAFNATTPGKVIVAGASGGIPMAGEGILLALQVTFLKEGQSTLVFEQFKFDPGNPATKLTHGRVRNISLANRDQHKNLPSGVSIKGNYPNPFRNQTWIVLDLHDPASVGIDVYNVHGQRVLRIPHRRMQSGSNQQIELDLSSVSTGTYIYRVAVQSQRGYETTTNFITVIR